MSKIILYGMDMSPPVRACLLTFKALELPFEYKRINMAEGEHLTEEYLAKNPQHTVPTLEDDGHFITDSHAIMAYLVSKYGKNDALYPKDYLKRAMVDQRLHFDCGVVFSVLRDISVPLFHKNEKTVPQHKIDAILQSYGFVETFLKDQPYIAGDQLTIADFSLITSLTTVLAIAEIDAIKYPKLTAWMRRLEQLPYYEEANGKIAKKCGNSFKSTNFVVVP